MKMHPLVIVILSVLGGCAEQPPADQESAARSPQGPAKTNAMVLEHDAGVVLIEDGRENVVSYEFDVANPSTDEAMRLRLLDKSCGCTTTAEVPETVPPGSTTVLRVAYPVTGRSLEERQVVRYATGLEEPEFVDLVLSAVVRETIAIDGGERLATKIGAGEAREIGVTVTTNRRVSEPEEPVRLVADSDHLEVLRSYPIAEGEVDGPAGQRLRSKKTHFVCLASAGGSGWGSRNQVPVVLRAVSGRASCERTLTLEIESPVVAVPNKVVFLNPAEGATKDVVVKADLPFRLIGSASDDGVVEVAVPSEPSKPARQHSVTLRLSAPGSGRVVRETISLRTDHPDQPAVFLPVSIINLVVGDDAKENP